MLHEWGRRGTLIGYWWEIQKERDHWQDQDIDGWMKLRWILERQKEWILTVGLAQDRDNWKAIVNAVLNFLVS
jgi:hypothetical protein